MKVKLEITEVNNGFVLEGIAPSEHIDSCENVFEVYHDQRQVIERIKVLLNRR